MTRAPDDCLLEWLFTMRQRICLKAMCCRLVRKAWNPHSVWMLCSPLAGPEEVVARGRLVNTTSEVGCKGDDSEWE